MEGGKSENNGISKPDNEKGLIEDSATLEGEVFPRGWTFVLLTVGLMAVVLVLGLDNYIIATAIPQLTTEFNELNLVGWYGSSYFLTLMAFQPAFGQLCTLFPVKTVYLISIVGFEIGSTLSASAPSSIVFIVGRVVSGAAGGGLWCGTLTLMAQAVPVSKRHLYVSVVTSMYGVASALGPLLGGIFTDTPKLTWRFCFWINLPIGFVAFIIIFFNLEPPVPTHLAKSLTLRDKISRIDIMGATLLIAAFTSLLIALQWAGTSYSWSDSKIWGCLLGFVLMTLAFIALQIRLKDKATIPLRIISHRTSAIGCVFTVFMTMAIGVHVNYLPLYFQAVLGTSAKTSGVRILPYLMALLISPMLSGSLISLIGYYVPFMWIGSILLTVGSGLIITLGTVPSTGEWVGYQFLAAFGAGICRQIAFSAVPLVLEKDDIATASALVAFCNSLGPTLAIGVGQVILTNTFVQQVSLIPGIEPLTIINSGAYDLKSVVPSHLLAPVRQAFDYALTRTFILSIASGAAAFCSSLAMEWINVKERD